MIERSEPVRGEAKLYAACAAAIVVLAFVAGCGPRCRSWRHLQSRPGSRWDPKVAGTYCNQLLDSQQKGEVATDTLYVLNRQWDQLRPQFLNRLRCAPLNGAEACVFDH